MIIILSLIISFIIVYFINLFKKDYRNDCINSIERYVFSLEKIVIIGIAIKNEDYVRIGNYIEKIDEISTALNDMEIKSLVIKMRNMYDSLRVKSVKGDY